MKTVKLIMVTAQNNNKYYDMVDNGDGTFTAIWGRVDATRTETKYPIDKWDSQYKSKCAKGYKDVTHLHVVETQPAAKTQIADISDASINDILRRIQKWANKSVEENYTISSSKVTPAMVAEAQRIMNALAEFVNRLPHKKPINDTQLAEFNQKLLDMFTALPRRMSDTRKHVVKNVDEDGVAISAVLLREKIQQTVSREQDILDSLAAVVSIDALPDDAPKADKITLLDRLGITMEKGDSELEKQVKKALGKISDKFVACFKVVHKKSRSRFDAHVAKATSKRVGFYWHGSRNENWLGLIEKGLLIRPSGAVHTGSMFGDGIYGCLAWGQKSADDTTTAYGDAKQANKSYGYTSGRGTYWANGKSDTAIMAIFECHVGKRYQVKNHTSECYGINEAWLKRKGGYDSVWAMGGADLQNDEHIFYNVAQTTIHALVELRG